MFADAALGARIDRAEARLSAKIAAAVRERRPSANTLVMPFAGGLAVYAGPSSPVNKVIGIGFDGPLHLASLEQVEAEWRTRGEPVRFELSILADTSVPPTLTARGYQVHGFENVLARPLTDPGPPAQVPGLSIEVLEPADEPAWLDITVTAFMNLDGSGSVADDSLPRADMERVLVEFASAPGFTRYLARFNGQPVGTASLHLDQGLAQIAGAGTLPEYRGRGIQKALLHRRLTDARGADCDLAVVTTAPGTRSQANVMARGFELLYTRTILLKRWS